MTLPDRVAPDGFGPVESDNKRYWALLNEMGRRGGRYGLQTMCEGGGMANATIVELV